jgi:hypothetical protein
MLYYSYSANCDRSRYVAGLGGLPFFYLSAEERPLYQLFLVWRGMQGF